MAMAFFEAFNGRDFDALAMVLDPDCLLIDSTGEPLIGAERVIDLILRLTLTDPSFHCVIEDSVGHRDGVLLRGRVETDSDDADGRTIWQMRAHGGRISRIQSFRKKGALPIVRLFGIEEDGIIPVPRQVAV